VPLKELCVGLDSIPKIGGIKGRSFGCMVGSGKNAHILHYSGDGLLLGLLAPGEAMCKESGWMDNHASVAVNRSPIDNVIDVFSEDDLNLRIGWYRVDDKPIEHIYGKIAK